MATIKENISRFESLMTSVNRDGKDALLDYIRNKTDFYTAPASSRFHLSCEGGLLQHSLNVYDCLIAKKNSPVWGPILEEVSDESLIVMALLHDFCKINFYVKGYKNRKTYDPKRLQEVSSEVIKHDDMGYFFWETVPTYEIRDTMPLGHGEKSVMLVNCFMKLKAHEIFAIRWHMGFAEERSLYKQLGEAMERYPIVLALVEADMEASKLMETEDGCKTPKGSLAQKEDSPNPV